jgi:hypothetical protein
MGREGLFDAELPQLRGLGTLTAPAPEEPVAAVVDVAVVGARSDGKTQFILHCIRTLDAEEPELGPAERALNSEIMTVVMAAASPRPDATNPEAGVPHYVFRVRPDDLARQVGVWGRLWLLLRTTRLPRHLAWTLLTTATVGAVLSWLGGVSDERVALATGGVALAGLGLARWLARRAFVRQGPIEIVFWDVAGEHLYGERQSAEPYRALMRRLVQERRQRARSDRRYAFAPVLIVNPLSLGEDADPPCLRLRSLLRIFASLNKPRPQALVVINRWQAVAALCPGEVGRDDRVAVVSAARDAMDEPASSATPPAERLAVVERDRIEKECVDLEDSVEDGVRLAVLRYDAGSCEVSTAPWPGWDAAPSAVRARYLRPAIEPTHLMHYRFSEGPGAFQGDARQVFLRWIARLAFRASTRQAPLPVGAPATVRRPDEQPAPVTTPLGVRPAAAQSFLAPKASECRGSVQSAPPLPAAAAAGGGQAAGQTLRMYAEAVREEAPAPPTGFPSSGT